MKRIYNFITLSVLAFGAIGCIEDINTDIPSAASGDEVQFGLSLDGPKTKTVYGEEADNAFPVYWVNGDKVAVYSPDCLTGRNSAEYQVSVSQAQNYADQLTKTGEVGVQWGSSDKATFYSIYPSANATISGTGNAVVASLNIPATQLLTHTLVNGTYYASDMNSVIMYAKKEANKSDEAVNLQYTPYSTVIEFELNGDFTDNTKASLFIESLTLTAAAPATEGTVASSLAGNFNFRFTDTPEISATGNNRSNVTLQFTTQPELNNTNKTLKAKMCLIPIEVTSLDNWTVSVTLREGDNSTKTFVKTITKTGESTALKAGEVHKIKLPALTATKEWKYTPEAWMPQLPEYEKIYLTELSIPGAWYAGTPSSHGYQTTQSIADLWKAGVRAFAVETRVITSGTVGSTAPSSISVSGTANNSPESFPFGTNSLHSDSKPDAKTNYGGTSLSSIITNVANSVNSDEFAVLILSYADGGSGGQRYVDHGAWLQLLYDTFNGLSTTVKNKIYQEPFTKNTTIEDVKGKVILKINIDKNIAKTGYVKWSPSWTDWTSGERSYEYNNNLPAVFSFNPFLAQISNNSEYGPYFSKLYWTTWEDSYQIFTTSANDDFSWCFSSANRTHTDGTGSYDIPTYAQRKSALNAMMSHSKDIHDKSSHNVWFYFNVGGTETASRTSTTDDENGTNSKAFAKEMNPWLLDLIQRKTNGYTANGVYYPSDPSPLGIVMFNQCTGSTTKDGVTTKGEDIIRAIIEMNNKFKLKREGGVENTLVVVDSWDTELL